MKLDKAFIDGVCTTAEDRAIVAAGITLAQALGAVTVAEGVETAEQATALRGLNCELAQCYFFARPLPPNELGQLFASGGAQRRCSGFSKSKRSPASHSERWLPCAGIPPASLSIRARWSRFQVRNVVLRFANSFSGPPEPGSR